MLLNSRGHQEASSDIQRRLKQVHPALNMVWMPAMGRFALTYAWPESDPRWQKVQRGELGMDACYDLWGWAPDGMRDEDAYQFLVQTLRRNTGNEDARKLLDRVYAYNNDVSAARDQLIVDDAEEYTRVHAPTIFAEVGKTISRVYQTNPVTKKKRRGA